MHISPLSVFPNPVESSGDKCVLFTPEAVSSVKWPSITMPEGWPITTKGLYHTPYVASFPQLNLSFLSRRSIPCNGCLFLRARRFMMQPVLVRVHTLETTSILVSSITMCISFGSVCEVCTKVLLLFFSLSPSLLPLLRVGLF